MKRPLLPDLGHLLGQVEWPFGIHFSHVLGVGWMLSPMMYSIVASARVGLRVVWRIQYKLLDVVVGQLRFLYFLIRVSVLLPLAAAYVESTAGNSASLGLEAERQAGFDLCIACVLHVGCFKINILIGLKLSVASLILLVYRKLSFVSLWQELLQVLWLAHGLAVGHGLLFWSGDVVHGGRSGPWLLFSPLPSFGLIYLF